MLHLRTNLIATDPALASPPTINASCSVPEALLARDDVADALYVQDLMTHAYRLPAERGSSTVVLMAALAAVVLVGLAVA